MIYLIADVGKGQGIGRRGRFSYLARALKNAFGNDAVSKLKTKTNQLNETVEHKNRNLLRERCRVNDHKVIK